MRWKTHEKARTTCTNGCFKRVSASRELLDVVLRSTSFAFAITICCAIHKLSSWTVEDGKATKEPNINFRCWKELRIVGWAIYGWFFFFAFDSRRSYLLFRFEFHHHVLFLILLRFTSKGQRHFKQHTWTQLQLKLPWLSIIEYRWTIVSQTDKLLIAETSVNIFHVSLI